GTSRSPAEQFSTWASAANVQAIACLDGDRNLCFDAAVGREVRRLRSSLTPVHAAVAVASAPPRRAPPPSEIFLYGTQQTLDTIESGMGFAISLPVSRAPTRGRCAVSARSATGASLWPDRSR